MIGFRNDRGLDLISTGFLATALISLSATLAVVMSSNPSRVPGRLLDRVSGATPGYFRSINQYPNCSAWNVYIDNQAGGKYVSWTDCGNVVGTACMQCANKGNYTLNTGVGTPLAFPKPIAAIDCNVPGGQVGTCIFVNQNVSCSVSDAFDCDQYASKWNLE